MAEARILLLALEDLRARFGAAATPGADPRHDTAAFRAFLAALLPACAGAARADAVLTMWWEGTYNGYFLAVAVEPAGALLAPDLAPVCPIETERLASPPAARYPLAVARPGHAEPARDADGALWEAPLGAATGHFGAPGMRRTG